MSRRLSPWSRTFRPRLDRLEGREVPALFTALTVVGPATSTLTNFDSTAPGTPGATVTVTGLDPGATLVGIDFRGSNGQLYGVSSNSRLYTIDPSTGAATAVGGTFSTPLNGTVFGVDFNPVADKLRIISNTNQNLRVNADTGAIVAVDTPQTYDPTTYNTVFPPQGPPPAPPVPTPSLVAGAYTKTANGAGGTDTTLYVVDNVNNSALSTQGSPTGTPVSPNSGVLFPVGSLGAAAVNPSTTAVGFDIQPGTSLALLASNGSLFSVDLATATATSLGILGGGPGGAFRDLAIFPAPPTLSAVPDQSIAYNGTTGPLPVTITDGAAPVSLTASTDNPGVVSVTVAGTGPNRTVTVTANPALTTGGTAVIDLTATDAEGQIGTTRFTVTVAAATPPTANPDTFTTPFGQTLSVPAPGVLSNDTVGSGAGPLTVVSFGPLNPAAAGTFTPTSGGPGGLNGGFTFVPAAGFSGPVTFTYTARDGVSNSAPATVTVTVLGPVTAANDAFTVAPAGSTFAAPGVLANDTAGSGKPLTATLVQDVPTGTGKLVLNTDGSFAFTPTPGFGSPVSFQYTASDGVSTSAPATVNLTISAPTAPVAPNRSYGPVAAGSTLTVPASQGLLSGITSPNGGTLRVLSATPAVGTGTLSFSPDGSFSFTPAAGATSASFTYQVTDDFGLPSNTATVSVSVTAGVVLNTRFTAYGTGAGALPLVQVVRPGQSTLLLTPFEPSFLGGVRVAVADLNLDGVDDIVCTAGPGGGPRVVVFDGTSGRQIANFFAFEPSFRGGAHAAAADALTPAGKRTSLLVVGAGSYAAQPGSPRVRAFHDLQGVPSDLASQSQGTAAIDYDAYSPTFQGGVRVAAGDLNGDGVIELVTIPGPSGGPDLRVWNTGSLSGTRPAQTQQFDGLGDPTNSYRGGAFVAVAAGAIVVSPDSLSDITGTELAAQAGTLPDQRGVAPPPVVISPATTSLAPRVSVFLPSVNSSGQASGQVTALPLQFDLNDPGFLNGVRVAVGATISPSGTPVGTLLVGYGAGGGGKVRQFAFAPNPGATRIDQIISTTSETQVFPFGGGIQDASIYVGLAPVPFGRPASPPPPASPGTGGAGPGTPGV